MIKTVNVRHKTFENYILLLGFFDCLHSGHIALIKEARKLAESCRSKVAMLTFTNDPAFVLGDSCGSVFTFLERVKKAERLRVDCILYSEFDEGFKKTSVILILSLCFLCMTTGNMSSMKIFLLLAGKILSKQ